MFTLQYMENNRQHNLVVSDAKTILSVVTALQSVGVKVFHCWVNGIEMDLERGLLYPKGA